MAKILAGKSYWHLPQGLGMHYVPGELRGYFNDLSRKTQYPGPIDDHSIPLVVLSNGDKVYFPTTIFHKGLGHWDLWLASDRQDEAHWDGFIKAAQWAVENQDDRGGWAIWSQLDSQCYSPYSAMTQGEGISLLVRAYSITKSSEYMECAGRAFDLMLLPVDEGGVCRNTEQGLILEEIPLESPKTVLNGWIYALFGVIDLSLVDPSQKVKSTLESASEALCRLMPQFDAGYWSYYDTAGTLSSPFYHRLHIAQLQALAGTFAQFPAFASYLAKFESQLESPVSRLRALVTKFSQKLSQRASGHVIR